MNLTYVKQLADLMAERRLSSLTYEDSEFKLSLSQAAVGVVSANLSPVAAIAEPEEAAEDANLVVITAPVVGTAYRAREPGKPPLVSVDDKVRQGDALCVIEAMKVFSEITAPCNGKVVDIAFTDGALAAYGAKLIVIEPAE